MYSFCLVCQQGLILFIPASCFEGGIMVMRCYFNDSSCGSVRPTLLTSNPPIKPKTLTWIWGTIWLNYWMRDTYLVPGLMVFGQDRSLCVPYLSPTIDAAKAKQWLGLLVGQTRQRIAAAPMCAAVNAENIVCCYRLLVAVLRLRVSHCLESICPVSQGERMMLVVLH